MLFMLFENRGGGCLQINLLFDSRRSRRPRRALGSGWGSWVGWGQVVEVQLNAIYSLVDGWVVEVDFTWVFLIALFIRLFRSFCLRAHVYTQTKQTKQTGQTGRKIICLIMELELLCQRLRWHNFHFIWFVWFFWFVCFYIYSKQNKQNKQNLGSLFEFNRWLVAILVLKKQGGVS